MSKFKVWVTTTGDNGSWSTNSIEHDTVEQAEQAARDLFSRWMAVERWAVLETDENFVGHLPDVTVRIHAVAKG